MGKREWGGTVLTACLIGLAGFFRDHTFPLILLAVGAMASAAVVAWDMRSEIGGAVHKLAGLRARAERVPLEADEHHSATAPIKVTPRRTTESYGSLATLEELLAEGEAMLQAANPLYMGAPSEYGPPTQSKVDNWKRRVLKHLPGRRDQFRFPGPESVDEKVFNGLKHGSEAKEVRRLRRHVEALKRLLVEIWAERARDE